ncbi:phosphatase PAP2 family protein [Glycomyces buryatensis]|uniref:Phosphatase PAP2 family protein n=1 Tax=Glycomyces buryatensis TaxID=2570927 RepID=A0A4S8Q225_9ACTN|nr:phosphatase PAP2 family protein [Glycomyces buryatensis]THV37151.1 phosphatase PAP2 family protein [Glycomyces buryatensis]
MTHQQHTVDRRSLLIGSAALAVGAAASTALPETAFAAPATRDAPPAQWSGTAFVDDYKTNTTDNLSIDTNAAVRILSGIEAIWQTGSSWDNGIVVDTKVLADNLAYCADITTARTPAESKASYIHDRQHQSYSALAGLGPLEAVYKAGAKAVTSITGAPDGLPDGKISDSVPADAPAGSATGAGATDSDLGKVVELVNTVRGNYSSSNPGKYTYQYPRPWRLNPDSEVVETEGLPILGVPVYETEVSAAVQLLRQRSDEPETDGGYPSGHTNAAWLASIALAYAIPERFQELLVRAADVGHTRILAGMHSPVDVIGGRILATALAAAILYDGDNSELKAAAREQAVAYLGAQTGTDADGLFSYAHREGPDTDPFADRDAGRARITERLTYVLERSGQSEDLTVPKGAEVLLETRLPYLDGEQRRQVLRTTALPSGYALLDGPEQWGRLDLFTAADGYGRFDGDVRVVMDADLGGFCAADAWRNDIGGSGKLHKSGSGSLTLSGDNAFTGEVYLEAGTIRAASATALGTGDVNIKGGALAVEVPVEVGGDYTQSGAVLDAIVANSDEPALTVAGTVHLETGSVLRIGLDPQRPPAPGVEFPVIAAQKIEGEFDTVELGIDGYTATATYSKRQLTIRID